MNLCKRNDSEVRLYKLMIKLDSTFLNHLSNRKMIRFTEVVIETFV